MGRRRARIWRRSRPEMAEPATSGRQQPGLGEATGNQGAFSHVTRQGGAGFQPRQRQHQQPRRRLQPLHRAAEPEQIVREARGQMRRGQEFHLLRRLGGRGAGDHVRLLAFQHPEILHAEPGGYALGGQLQAKPARQHLPAHAVMPGEEAKAERGLDDGPVRAEERRDGGGVHTVVICQLAIAPARRAVARTAPGYKAAAPGPRATCCQGR